MNHDDFKEMIQLYLYGELETDNKSMLEDHFKVCEDCEKEYELFKMLFEEVKKDSNQIPDEDLLLKSRYELRGYLRAVRNKESINKNVKSIYSGFITNPFTFAFSSIAFIMLGLFIGYFLFRIQVPFIPENNSFAKNQSKIRNINFLDSDPSDGVVEFTYDAVETGYFKGNISDPELKTFLASAVLNEQNPGTRLNSINVINASQQLYKDEEIKYALINAAKYDKNPGVRREALLGLKEIGMDNDVKSAFIYVLINDTSAGLRITAINSIREAGSKGGVLTQGEMIKLNDKLQNEKNNYIRIQAKNILKEY